MITCPPTATERGVRSPTAFCATSAMNAAGTLANGVRGSNSAPPLSVIPRYSVGWLKSAAVSRFSLPIAIA